MIENPVEDLLAIDVRIPAALTFRTTHSAEQSRAILKTVKILTARSCKLMVNNLYSLLTGRARVSLVHSALSAYAACKATMDMSPS